MIPERPDIPSLTGLRFVAATSVAIAHFSIPADIRVFGFQLQLSLLGMPLFFCLSGFVIHYVYATDLSGHWGPATRVFALARFSRIYPLFAFLLTYFLLFTPLGDALKTNGWATVSYITATGSWWYWLAAGAPMQSLPYGWSWSISTEMFFYVIYAVGLYRIYRIESPRRCLFALIGLCLFAYAVLYLTFIYSAEWESFVLERNAHFFSRQTNYNASFYRWLIYISPYFHLFEFIGGVLVCQLFLALKQRGIAVSSFGREAIAWFGVAWICVLLGLCIFLMERGTQAAPLQFIVWLHMSFLLGPGCLALILALALGVSSVSRLLSARWAVFLGTVSYSIYLCHLMLIPLFVPQPGATFPWLRLAMALAMIAILSTGLYVLIEAPAKRGIRALAAALVSQKGQISASARPAE